ncbi:MAG: DUF1674 domain-containing protein [Wenzhouxiangella sp.]
MSEEEQTRKPEPDRKDPSTRPAVRPGKPKEIGGRKNGLDPVRYGDWEKNGRCIDF